MITATTSEKHAKVINELIDVKHKDKEK